MEGLIMSDQSLNEFQSELCENMDINDLNLEENDISNHLKRYLKF